MDDDAFTRAYEPSETELHWHDEWVRAGAFRPQSRFGNETPPFVVLLPPPNVTGVLHMGHVLSSTIQDVFVRYQRMLGRETLWWPGTDHAGIATQKVVEKNLRQDGIEPRELGRDKFVEVCWEWKKRSHRHIVRQMQRVGWSLDWEREYFTLDEHMSDAVREAFIRLYRKGLVYRGRYITNWCPNCKTALSDEEVQRDEAQGTLWTVRYPRVDGKGFVEVATTRPETILGDVAVAIHPEDERAADLVGTRLHLPVLGREVPVVADAYVDPEFGTGLVKITPAHDPNDFQVGQRHGLQMPVVIDPDGRMNELAGPFAGLDRFDAREQLLRRLQDEGLLVDQKPHAFARGTHDRCGTIIEPYLSEQWFVRMKPLAEPAIRAVEQERVHFFPERWRNVYLHWMRNIQDWCISRQLWWGHRIPVYYCNGCGEQVAAHEAPTEACTTCGDTAYRQDEDVLDTWFSSWLCPISPMGWPRETEDLRHFHPTTMLVTGPDIIFFWVARMIMASLEFVGEVPFRHVLLNGILRDGTGRKISKSHGNAIDPLRLIDKHGADALRFSTVMLSPPGQDTFFDENSVVTGRNFANKIWNAARLVLSSARQRGLAQSLGLDAAPAPAGTAAELPEPHDRLAAFETLWWRAFNRVLPEDVLAGLRLEDRWILHAFDRAAHDVNQSMRGMRANDGAGRIYRFFWDEFCAWYLESIKPRFYGDDAATGRTAHAVALVLLAESCKLLSPWMPHLAEELWRRLPGTRGLVLTEAFPQAMPALRDPEADDSFGMVMQATSAIRTLRADRRVPPGKKAPALVQSAPGDERWEGEAGALLQLHAKLESLSTRAQGRPEGAAALVVRDTVLYVPLGGLIDLHAERQRLRGEIDEADEHLARLDAKLSNRGFVDKAPAEVVARERERRTELAERRERLRTSLAEISGKG